MIHLSILFIALCYPTFIRDEYLFLLEHVGIKTGGDKPDVFEKLETKVLRAFSQFIWNSQNT